MKKLSVLLVAVVMLLAFTAIASAATIADLTSAPSYAQGNIKALADKGIVSGDEKGNFNATANVTRAEFAKMIILAQGQTTANPVTGTFSDVKTTDWFYGYVEAAATAGLINGYNGQFRPNDKITREEVAKILVVAAGKVVDPNATPSFKDAASISAWAKGYVVAAAAAGLIKGDENGNFNAKANAIKADAATMVARKMGIAVEATTTPVVYTNTLTSITRNNDSARDDDTPIAIVVRIGGKSYTVDSDTEYWAGDVKVNGWAVRENTKVAATYNSGADKVKKIVLSDPDYKVKKGTITALGKSGSQKYVLFEDGTKVLYDKASSYYSLNYQDDDDAITTWRNAGNWGVGTASDPSVNTDYLVIMDETGKGYYFLALDTATVDDVVSSAGKDSKGEFIVINDKQYYVDDNSRPSITINGVTNGNAQLSDLQNLVEKSVKITTYANGTLKTIVVYDVLKGYVADWPVVFQNDSNYEIYVKVTREQDKKFYATGGANYFWLALNPVNYPKESDLPDNYRLYTARPAGINPATFANNIGTDANGAPIYVLDQSASISIAGKGEDLEDLKKWSYLEAKYHDGDLDTVDTYPASAKGVIEKFTKDSNDNVIGITISGKDYEYIGYSKPTSRSSKGYVWAAGAGNGAGTDVPLYTGETNIYEAEVGDIAGGVLDKDGKMIATFAVNDPTISDGKVVAVAGEKSTLTNSDSDADIIYVPGNTIEVQYNTGNSQKVAWIALDYKERDASNASNIQLSDDETVISGVWSKNGGYSFNSIKKGDTVSAWAFGYYAMNLNNTVTAADDTPAAASTDGIYAKEIGSAPVKLDSHNANRAVTYTDPYSPGGPVGPVIGSSYVWNYDEDGTDKNGNNPTSFQMYTSLVANLVVTPAQ